MVELSFAKINCSTNSGSYQYNREQEVAGRVSYSKKKVTNKAVREVKLPFHPKRV